MERQTIAEQERQMRLYARLYKMKILRGKVENYYETIKENIIIHSYAQFSKSCKLLTDKKQCALF